MRKKKRYLAIALITALLFAQAAYAAPGISENAGGVNAFAASGSDLLPDPERASGSELLPDPERASSSDLLPAAFPMRIRVAGSGMKESGAQSGNTLTVTITGNYNRMPYWNEDRSSGDAVCAYLYPILNFSGNCAYKSYSDNSSASTKRRTYAAHSVRYRDRIVWYEDGAVTSEGDWDSSYSDASANYAVLSPFARTSLSSVAVTASYGEEYDSNIVVDGSLQAVDGYNDSVTFDNTDQVTGEGREPIRQYRVYPDHAAGPYYVYNPGGTKPVKLFDSLRITTDFGTKTRNQPCTTTFVFTNPHPMLSSVTLMMREYGQYSTEADHITWDRDEYEEGPVTGTSALCNFQAAAAKAHTHDPGTVTETPAACTAPGRRRGECASCGQKIDEIIPMLGHAWPSSYVTNADNGTYYKNCTRCGARLETKKNPYTVQFHANGGSGFMETLSMTYDTAKALTKNQFTRTAYLFEGWTANPDGSGAFYADGQLVKNLTPVWNGTVNLYAKWKLNECAVTYDANGGSCQTETGTVLCKTAIGAAALSEAERYGYTFLGWSLKKDGPDALLTAESQMEAAAATFYAQWRANGYEVTMDPAGGTLPAQETRKVAYFDSPLGELPQPEKKGETFTGWAVRAQAAEPPVTESTVLKTEGLSLIATYSAEAYTICFDANGGTTKAQEIQRSYGQAYGTLPEATRTGYRLKGWFTEREGGRMVTASSAAPACDQTLYAHWEPLTYQIRFDANGGSGTMASQYVDYGETVELSENRFSLVDHRFAGWTANPDGSGAFYADGQPVVNLTDTEPEVTLYAKWERVSAVLSFYDWDGTFLGQASCDIGEKVDYPAPLRTGYTFTGWEGIDGAPAESVTGPGSYRAVYAINRYTARFLSGGIQIGEREKAYRETLGALPEAEKEGYTFTGWNERADGSGAAVTAETRMPAGGLTAWAQFQKNTYRVTFHYEGGTEGEASREVFYGEMLGALPESEKTGFVLAGWSAAQDGSEAVTAETRMGAGPLDLYAVWKTRYLTCRFLDDTGRLVEELQVPYGGEAAPRTPQKTGYVFASWDKPLDSVTQDTAFAASFRPASYRISFAVNRELYPQTDGSMDPVPAVYDRIRMLPGNAFKKEHFAFSGWSREADGSGARIPDRASVINLTAQDGGEVVLYAQFTRTESPCSWRDWDGTLIREEIIPYGGDGTAPADPRRAGYTFTGWDRPAEGITEPAVFTAQYRANRWTVTFDANGGSGAMEPQAMEYDREEALRENSFARTDYAFAGWNTERAGGGVPFADQETVQNLTAQPDGAVTLYAQWEFVRQDLADGTHVRPGADGIFGTADDEIWTDGPDGLPGTEDDQKVKTGESGQRYVEGKDGTYVRPGADGVFGTADDEIWQLGPDQKPYTADDRRSTGGRGHSSGGGGGSSSGHFQAGNTGAFGPAVQAREGSWIWNPDGSWSCLDAAGRPYASCWKYLKNPYASEADGQSVADWFRFDADGRMVTGWYTDTDGNRYYLWPVADGSQGHMVTGWQWLPGADGLLYCYYFNPVSDGTKGRLYRDETTPDGFTVNARGEREGNGVAKALD